MIEVYSIKTGDVPIFPLLTANRSAGLGMLHAVLIAMSLTHLDVILQEKGYNSPIAECE